MSDNLQVEEHSDTSPDSETIERERLMEEREKTKAERRKIELEIADLRRAWWKRPSYLQALLPLSIVIVSSVSALIVTWSNGFFDEKRIELQREKAVLQEDVTNAKAQRQALQAQLEVLQAQREELQKDVATLQEETVEMQTSIKKAAQIIVDLSKGAPKTSKPVVDKELLSTCQRLLTQINAVRAKVDTPSAGSNGSKP